jgi:hypothetical protein
MTEHAEPIVRWKVRYEPGGEQIEVLLPHAWRQDMPAGYVGPVQYETTIKVPRAASTLLFHGASYAAEVFIEGGHVLSHRGIWDAFAVPLDAYKGRTIGIRVDVTKNGGSDYPVGDVASGFLPYVFHTFGGLYGSVELLSGQVCLDAPAASSRVTIDGPRIYVDGRPFYLRGILHWGWYPELGHTNVPEATIREEVQALYARGFNLVKFCLWVPPHRYLDILREQRMEAWIELPLWKPTDSSAGRAQIAAELEAIVRQYRRHDNIIAWSVGCELGDAVPYEYRAGLTQLVRNLTNCPLVKDSGGGAEQYGGDPREGGTFFDFHPYGEPIFLPEVLDSLLPGARQEGPILLGECMDADVHRDIARIGDEMPFWASALSELNPRGVRWLHDLPAVVADSRYATQPTRSGHTALMASSREQAAFVRKTVAEAIRARDEISGYVATGLRDTPISSSGFFDDWGEPRFSSDECLWNDGEALFLIPARRPPWTAGGNRAGWADRFNHFAGPVLWRIGLHAASGASGGLVWRLTDESGKRVTTGALPPVTVDALSARQVGEIFVELKPGAYRLEAEFGEARSAWPIWVVPAPSRIAAALDDPMSRFEGLSVTGNGIRISTQPEKVGELTFLTAEGTRPAPFWREAAYEFHDSEFWAVVPFANQWARLLAVGGDRVLDEEWLRSNFGDYETLMNRVDTRTYAESPVLARHAGGLVTTLRPFGGLGIQPTSVAVNPAGIELLRSLIGRVEG